MNSRSAHPPQFFISLYGWTYWLPVLLAGSAATVVFLIIPHTLWLAILFAVLTLACLAFYRDFNRPIPADPDIMVAPADGKVTEISRIEQYAPFNGPALKIGIFLSVLDVHVNRSPCDGAILWTRYEEGLFLDARHPDCSAKNQSHTLALGPPQWLSPLPPSLLSHSQQPWSSTSSAPSPAASSPRWSPAKRSTAASASA